MCGSIRLVPYLSLGTQPLANNYHKAHQKLERYPLGVQVCENCFHSQLTHKVDNHLMFDEYIYVSGTSETLNKYFRQFTNTVLKNWKGKKPPRVLEIACNDGTLLRMFKDRGCDCWGVEPAQNLWSMCEGLGLRVWGGYWDKEAAKTLGECGKFDIIIAVNVLPHVPNPVEFMEACKLILDSSTKGSGIYIQTSQCDMFKNGEFDAIYHEHHSYFTVSSFGTLAYAANLEIKEAKKVPIHSMSFLFKLGPMTGQGHSDSLYNLLEEENAEGWHTVERYKEWAGKAESKRTAFKAFVAQCKKTDRKLVGYGASAKANTVLNYFGVSLDFIVDDNPMKWGLLTPGRDIPIVEPRELSKLQRPAAIVLTAWNFKEEILEKVRTLMPKHFSWPYYVMTYIPEVKIEGLFDYGGPKTKNNTD